MKRAVKLSIIIPNLHSPIIDQTIESVLAQKTNLPFEVIVVGMDKWGLVKQYPEVQHIQTRGPVGAAEARNIGIQAARGEWLFFIDSDCIAQEGWIEALVAAFNDGWQIVGGGVLTPEEPFLLLVYNLSMFHAQLSSQRRKMVAFMPTLNLAVQHEVIERIGLMDEFLLRGQDVDWTARMTLAGFRLLFEPHAKVLHLPSRKEMETLRNYFHKSGYYMIRVRLRYPEIFRMPVFLKKGISYKVFAPIIAALTTIKIIMKTKEVRNHLSTIPYIYALKAAWCQGAAESLTSMRKDTHD